MTISINRNLSTPLYIQIKEMLKESIIKGRYQPNEKVPSEIELAHSLGVSRMTINKVVNELVREGFLYRTQGKGTFVSSRKIDQWFFKITSFNRDMISRGLTPSTSVIEKKVMNAPREVARHLHLKSRERVIFIKRLRYANQSPLMLESRYLNYHLCKPILQESLEKESIHDLLINKYNLPLTKVNQSLEAVKMNEDEAALLGTEPGEPGFLLCRTTFTGETPVTWVKYIYRSDKYRFYAEFVPIE